MQILVPLRTLVRLLTGTVLVVVLVVMVVGAAISARAESADLPAEPPATVVHAPTGGCPALVAQ